MFYPGGAYRFTSKPLALIVRNVNGYSLTEAEFNDGQQRVKVTIDESVVPGVIVSESIDGKEVVAKYKDRQEFHDKAAARARLYDDLLRQERDKQIEGDFEIQGPAKAR